FGSPTSILICSDEVRKRPTFFNVANPHCDMEVCLDILRDRDFGFVHQMLTFTREHTESETAFSNRFGTPYLARIEHMTKYGRMYLSEKEYEACIKKRRNDYYAFLGSMALRSNEEGFWEYHRKNMRRLGCSLSVGLIVKAAIIEVFAIALNPLDTLSKMFRKLSFLQRAKAKKAR